VEKGKSILRTSGIVSQIKTEEAKNVMSRYSAKMCVPANVRLLYDSGISECCAIEKL